MRVYYEGYEIRRTTYQGLPAYKVPALEGNDLAANLETAKKWIRCALAEGVLKRRNRAWATHPDNG